MKTKRRLTPVASSRGRPRAFHVEKALDAALAVFWEKGYEGTTLSDLTNAMGINRPSLYAAFGNKEALFRKALNRYIEGPAQYIAAALEKPTGREVALAMLDGLIQLLTDPRYPGGCLIVQCALTCGDEARSVREALLKRRIEVETIIRKRLEKARNNGDLRKGDSPAELARYLTTVMRGLAVRAADGATGAELRRDAELAMRAWPK
jgi:AcrR family transcriptional regulator